MNTTGSFELDSKEQTKVSYLDLMGQSMQDAEYNLRRIVIFEALRCKRPRSRAGAAIRPGPSCEISAITLAPRDLFYALLRARYLALLGLRIRSRKRTCVDAAIHQLGELPRLPGAVEVGVHSGVLARRELHLAFCGGHGVADVHLELR